MQSLLQAWEHPLFTHSVPLPYFIAFGKGFLFPKSHSSQQLWKMCIGAPKCREQEGRKTYWVIPPVWCPTRCRMGKARRQAGNMHTQIDSLTWGAGFLEVVDIFYGKPLHGNCPRGKGGSAFHLGAFVAIGRSITLP